MPQIVSLTIFTILSIIALIHVYWAFGGTKGVSLAIPLVDGANAFTPSAIVTLLVAVMLALFVILPLILIDTIHVVKIPIDYIQWGGVVVGSIFFLRSIGDFNLVGFSKKRKQGQFATLDSWLYSPLCLLLGAGYFYLVWGVQV